MSAPIHTYIVPAGPDALKVTRMAHAVAHGVCIVGADALPTLAPFHVGTLADTSRTVADTRKGAADGATREQVTLAASRAFQWIARHLPNAADPNVAAAYSADAGAGGMLLAARKRMASRAARAALADGQAITVALASGDVLVAGAGKLPAAADVAGTLTAARKRARSTAGATYARALAASAAPMPRELTAGE